MNVLGGDINVVEQVFMHKPHITLKGIRLHGIIFIQVKSDHIPETQALLAVEADQFVVHGDRRRTGSQAQDTGFAFLFFLSDEFGNLPGHDGRSIFGGGINLCRDLFKFGNGCSSIHLLLCFECDTKVITAGVSVKY